MSAEPEPSVEALLRAAAAAVATPRAVLGALGERRPAVRALGDRAGAVADALAEPGEGAVWVAAFEGWRPAALREIAADARARGAPLLPITARDGRLTVGPLLEPEGGPCFACWRYRALTHADDPRAAIEADALPALPGDLPPAARARALRVAAALVGLRASRGPLPGLAVEIASGPVIRRVARRDGCPQCRPRPAITVTDPLARADRLVDPRYGPIAAIRVGEAAGLWYAEVRPANLGLRPEGPSLLYGRGLDAAACLRSGIGEAIERMGLVPWEVTAHAEPPAAPIAGVGDAIAEACDTPVGWLPARRWPDKRPGAVPFGAAFGRGSTGLAAGIDADDAAGRALLEVIERDAFARFWAGGADAVGYDPHTHPDPAVRALVEARRAAGVTLHLARLPSPLGGWVFAAVAAADRAARGPAFAVGLGAGFGPVGAARSALTEAAQVRRALARRMADPDTRARSRALGAGEIAPERPIDHGLWAADPRSAPAVDRVRRPEARPLPVDAGSRAALAARFADVGRHAALVDVSPPSVAAEGWRVIRAIVPGARRVTFGPPTPPSRARWPHPFC